MPLAGGAPTTRKMLRYGILPSKRRKKKRLANIDLLDLPAMRRSFAWVKVVAFIFVGLVVTLIARRPASHPWFRKGATKRPQQDYYGGP